MNLNHIKISGLCPDPEALLSDIAYIEGIFFNKNSKCENSQKQPADRNSKKTPFRKKESSNESEEESDLPKSDSSNDEPLEDSNNLYDSAHQIYLRDVGDRITARFANSGNRFIKKAQRNSFVIYLYDKDGSLMFLSGTQLQEAIDEVKPKADQLIMIEKIGQFKRAKERSHAKPAIFKITKV